MTRDLSAAPVKAILSRVEGFRTPDGGYSQSTEASHGTAYAAFLAMGAYQDFAVCVPEPDRLLTSVNSLRAKDGGFANVPGAAAGGTTATAAA